jgi:hypothetical protein
MVIEHLANQPALPPRIPPTIQVTPAQQPFLTARPNFGL